jgi:hypothetical protein
MYYDMDCKFRKLNIYVNTYLCTSTGYAKNHAAGYLSLYNPKNRTVIETRDVRWSDWKRLDPKKDMSNI